MPRRSPAPFPSQISFLSGVRNCDELFIVLRSNITGNLLNSLMGSGEEEEGEEVREDSSPIELD